MKELQNKIRRVWTTGEHMVNEGEFVAYMVQLFYQFHHQSLETVRKAIEEKKEELDNHECRASRRGFVCSVEAEYHGMKKALSLLETLSGEGKEKE